MGTRWTVDEVNGRRTIERAQPTIGFTENRASGRTGCNQFGGSAVITGTSLEVGPLEMTMMACSEEIMEQEHRFVGALGVARAYVVDDGALTVLDGDGKAVIRASRLPGGAD